MADYLPYEVAVSISDANKTLGKRTQEVRGPMMRSGRVPQNAAFMLERPAVADFPIYVHGHRLFPVTSHGLLPGGRDWIQLNSASGSFYRKVRNQLVEELQRYEFSPFTQDQAARA